NSATRNGRKPSPRLPIIGRRIWSRTNRMPSSPTFWTPLGTSLGLAKAAQKKAITIAAQITASSIGLLNVKEPIRNSGPYRKLSGEPGAGEPQPEFRCADVSEHFSAASATRSADNFASSSLLRQ